MHAGRRQRVTDGGQTSVPWRLSRSVIDSVGRAAASSPCRIGAAESCAAGAGGRSQIIRFRAFCTDPGMRSIKRVTGTTPTDGCRLPGSRCRGTEAMSRAMPRSLRGVQHPAS